MELDILCYNAVIIICRLLIESVQAEIRNAYFTRHAMVNGNMSLTFPAERMKTSTSMCAKSCSTLDCRGFALRKSDDDDTTCRLSIEVTKLPFGQWTLYYSRLSFYQSIHNKYTFCLVYPSINSIVYLLSLYTCS